MAQVGFVFAAGLSGVFLSMGLIYGTIRITAAVVALLDPERKKSQGNAE